ncbi:NADP-dependent oxidoreductase [Aminobacter sp. MSH1]|uniref:quinone oxidoreductase family protein n=1 Tax=Aminobacter sp. MSH1 TaxID=374606 RepID=UPI000D3D582D|nr:NADP-dependent oxidoreductase [Aminobacter sp. MSH1]
MKNSTDEPLFSNAVVYDGRGSYEVIRIVERTVRAPASGEVRIEVKAAAVNPTDVLLRENGYADQPALIVPGMDAAGIVESVGAGVSRLNKGDKVMAGVLPRRPEGGAQAQHIVVPAASVVHIPEGFSFAEAATLPMNGLTALLALEIAGLEKGRLLAVSGGAGLLACYTIAIAKRQGLTIIADARPEDATLVQNYGADIVVERGLEFAAAVRRELPGGVDAMLDTALLGEKSFGAIRNGGVYLPVRGWGGRPAERDIKIKPVAVFDALERTEWLELLRGMAAAAEIRLRVTKEYAPEHIAEAQRSLTAGGLRGRPVVVF